MLDFSMQSHVNMTVCNSILVAFVIFLPQYVQALRSLKFPQQIGAKPSIQLGL